MGASADDRELIGLGIALALGLLVGLEREWAREKPIGLRSFALISLLGGVSVLLVDTMGGWPMLAGLIGLSLILAVKVYRRQGEGITTVVAGLVVFLIGAVAASGLWLQAIVLGGAVTLVLHWKEPMHGLVARLGEDDLGTIARFVLIAFVVLPVLPDETYGPYDVFNPFDTWLMVVLIVGMNLAGYVALRLIGTRSGGWLAGLLGGMVSSTATTFSYSNLSRQNAGLGALATLVILSASVVVYPRIALEVSVVAPGLLAAIAGPAITFAAVLLALAGIAYMRLQTETGSGLPHQTNPARIKTALTFGALYVVVLLAVAAAGELVGNDALYAVAFLSGLTDVDALTLSISRLSADGNIAPDTAWRAIFLASLANLAFKTAVAAVIGSPSLRRWILATGIPAIVAGVLILLLWP